MFFLFLSDGDTQLLQNAHPLLLVLLAGEPEVVLVLHDVGKYRPAKENHVLPSGRVLDADLEFLFTKKKKGRK